MRLLKTVAFGNRDVVAVKRQKDGRATGQPDHIADIAFDFDRVVGAKRLADRQHDGCDKILDRVLDGKADCQTNNTGGPQYGRQQRAGPDVSSATTRPARTKANRTNWR